MKVHPLDSQRMDEVIRRSPEQFRAGLAAAEGITVPGGPFTDILLAGMGGSWMAGALLADAALVTVPLAIHRGYGLPRGTLATTLVLASSFSGNTEETLSAYDAAKEERRPLVGIAAGGELERRCAEDGVPFVKILSTPPTMQPRSATGYTVGILTQLLANAHLAADHATDDIAALTGALHDFMETARARGDALVPAIRKRTPVIYASDRYRAVARIWKIKINENAKTPAFWNVFPELNHNEMIGWTIPHGSFHLIVLRDENDHPRVLKRFDVTLDLLRKRGMSVSMVPIEGISVTEKLFTTLLVGDWLSYELALALGMDPSPVLMVEDLKKRLKE